MVGMSTLRLPLQRRHYYADHDGVLTRTKREDDILYEEIDLTGLLDGGVVESVTSDASGVTISNLVVDGTKIKFTVSGTGECEFLVTLARANYDDDNGNVVVKVYDASDDDYSDLSASSARSAFTDDYQLLPDADAEAADDALLIGYSSRFSSIRFNDLTNGNARPATWAAASGKWQCSSGAGTWRDVTVTDGTDANAGDGTRPLQQAGTISFTPDTDRWVKATYDGEDLYWMRWVFTDAQLSAVARIDDAVASEPFIDTGYRKEQIKVRWRATDGYASDYDG